MIGSTALRIRAASAALALVAGISLIIYEPATLPASGADEGELTDSAVTIEWSKGITGTDNKTTIEGGDRDPEHYMHGDFDGLALTVSQTENLQGQALTVTWSGWEQTPGAENTLAGNYMQFMQCWGDEDTGPLPENCVWGAHGMADIGADLSIRGRSVAGDDPLAGQVPPHYDDPDSTDATVPFRPANDDDALVYFSELPTQFTLWTTNEVRGVRTDGDGNGEAVFTVQDNLDAPHLGCGRPVEDAGGSVDGRDCWLVAVPHGMHLLDGTSVGATGPFANGSPLTPTLWAQRIQVHLDFAPIGSTCPAGAEQRITVGTELVAEAMRSWQPALCAGDGATYSYIPTADSAGRGQVMSNLPGAPGLAFTYAPVVTGDGGPEILHAPVAVSGVAIALNIEETDGTIVRDVKLTPRLVAKLLTQSYRYEVPGGYEAFAGVGQPEWLANSPSHISLDPEFRDLNPDVPAISEGATSLAANILRVAGPNPADAIRELWRWIQADDEATGWLNGEPDENGMIVNPFFENLNLDRPPASDTIARDVDGCYRPGGNPNIPERGYCSPDLLPFALNFNDSARQARLGRPGSKTGWDTTAANPSGGQGWWVETPPQTPGRRWQLAVTDTASAELYSLPTASLLNVAGQFVQPDPTGLAAGVAASVPTEVDGVAQINPEAEDPSAYPLTVVTNAAVREEQDETALADYAALLTHVAGPGQVPGHAAGQLPPGYMPLNDQQRALTLAVAEDLATPDEPYEPPKLGSEDGADQGDDPNGEDPGGDESGDNGDENGGVDEDGTASGDAAEDGLDNGGNDAPDPVSLSPNGSGDDPPGSGDDPPAGGDVGGDPPDGPPPLVDDPSNPVAQTTPGEPIGPMQYALLVVLIVGLVGALGGPALLKLGPSNA